MPTAHSALHTVQTAVFVLMSTHWQLLVNITSIMQLGITITLKSNLYLIMIGQSVNWN